jgi:Holliday junction DNA helicase RuvA
MISSLRGPVLEIRLDSLVIGVGGVGMTVMCSPDTISQARIDQEITLFTSLIVREDSLTLFGFANSENREMFEVVQGVSGFGPKLAFTILSSLPADELRTAIGNEDVARLKQTPGVGAKGAQRLVLELKDRIGTPSSGARRSSSKEVTARLEKYVLGWMALCGFPLANIINYQFHYPMGWTYVMHLSKMRNRSSTRPRMG